MATAGIARRAAGELPSSWKAAKRGWGHPLHKLSPYVGGFPAALARFFVLNLSDPGDVVLDPFSGRGTTVLEALLCGREAVGSDAFEYAVVLSRAKAAPLSYDELEAFLRAKVREAAQADATLDTPDLRVFFSDRTLDQLVRLRAVLRGDDSREATFAKATICGVLHGPSKMFLSAPQKDQTSSTVGYVRRYLERNGIERPERDVLTCALAEGGAFRPRPPAGGRRHRVPERLARAPARRRKRRPRRDVAAVSGGARLRVEQLAPALVARLRPARGARQAHPVAARGRLPRIHARDVRELHRVLSDDAAAVIVVGDVKGLNSALLIAEEATAVGFEVDCVIDDVYQLNARSMLVLNSRKWDYDAAAHSERSSVLIDRCLVCGRARSTGARLRSTGASRAPRRARTRGTARLITPFIVKNAASSRRRSPADERVLVRRAGPRRRRRRASTTRPT